jgi:hypothetical protein
MNQITRRSAFARRACQIVTALAAVSVAANAQTTPAASSGPKEEVVALSKFEVSTTQGKGYVATNAASGFKTNQELIKIRSPLRL